MQHRWWRLGSPLFSRMVEKQTAAACTTSLRSSCTASTTATWPCRTAGGGRETAPRFARCRQHGPLPSPRTDGVAPWQASTPCARPARTSRFRGSHIRMAINPAVLLAVLDRLGQPEAELVKPCARHRPASLSTRRHLARHDVPPSPGSALNTTSGAPPSALQPPAPPDDEPRFVAFIGRPPSVAFSSAFVRLRGLFVALVAFVTFVRCGPPVRPRRGRPCAASPSPSPTVPLGGAGPQRGRRTTPREGRVMAGIRKHFTNQKTTKPR